jgi:DNA invertase Pin-like site-specific DNA recombinase
MYLRMSTDRQEDSPERQRSQSEPYIVQQGYRLTEEYLDPGIAGDEFDRRPAFQRLLRDAQAGKFEVIVCDELSRLSRQEVVDFIATVVHPLRAAGVRVDTVAEGPQGWDDIVQIIMLAIRQDKAASESPKMARRVLSSHLLLAGKCGYTGGPPPYGYLLVPCPTRAKKLVPDPVKAKHVQLIFRMIDEGHTLGDVRAELYRRGVPSPTGKALWSRNGLYRILRNRKYVGDYKWGEQALGKHVRQGNGQMRARRRGEKRFATNPKPEWVIKPDDHEPLIDRAQFERVQARLTANQERKTPHVQLPTRRGIRPVGSGAGFVLNKLLVCGHCGSHMLGTRTTGQARRIYVCGGWVSYGKKHCQRNGIPQEPLAAVLVRKLQAEFLNPGKLQALRDEIRRQEEAARDVGRVDAIKKQVEDLARKIDQGNERLLTIPADRVAGASAKLREWEKERDRLAEELDRIAHLCMADDLEKDIAAAEAMLWKLRDALRDEDADLLHRLLRELVSKVELYWTHRKTRCHTRVAFQRGVIHVRLQAAGHFFSGNCSSSAMAAQHVDAKLIHCDLPPGSPLSKNT